MTGAFAGRNVGERFEVVSAVAKLTDRTGASFMVYIHEALFDPNPAQVESLLAVHQALRRPSVRIDDRSIFERDVRGLPGTQKSVIDQRDVAFYFDGAKCFYELSHLTEADKATLPKITLSSDTPYDPHVRQSYRRAPIGPNKVD